MILWATKRCAIISMFKKNALQKQNDRKKRTHSHKRKHTHTLKYPKNGGKIVEKVVAAINFMVSQKYFANFVLLHTEDIVPNALCKRQNRTHSPSIIIEQM